MDPSTTPNEVSVPKVIPMKTTFGQKMGMAKKRADKLRRKKKMVQDIQRDQARHGVGKSRK